MKLLKISLHGFKSFADKVTIDIKDRFHFNTAIAALMELLNDMSVIKLANNDDYAMFKEVIRQLMREKQKSYINL